MAEQSNLLEIYQLINQLHGAITGRRPNRESVKRTIQYVTAYNRSLDTQLPYDESALITKITNNLAERKSKNESIQFLKCYELLSTCLDSKHRNAILTFLLGLSVADNGDTESAIRFACTNFTERLSTRFGGKVFPPPPLASTPIVNVANNTAYQTPMSFGAYSNNQSRPSAIRSTSDNHLNALALRPHMMHSSSSTDFSVSDKADASAFAAANAHTEEIVQDLIYACTGIQGKFLRKDIIAGGFKLDAKNSRSLSATDALMLMRLVELGFYHDQLQSFCDAKSGRSALGLLGQGLVTVFKAELTQYYGLVAMLQDQLNRQTKMLATGDHSDHISLMKVMLWAAEPLNRLYWLSTIGEVCQEKKGGALATTVATFRNNGDPMVKALANDLCLAVCGPLLNMLKKWLLEGEIEDPHSEFFIECLAEIGPELLWSDKYRVREAMLPQFISRECAHNILVTGKSINFLRERCKDNTPVKDRDLLRQALDANGEELFADVADTKLHTLIDTIYLNTSKCLLDIAKGPHKLLQNLQAMRNYLLLGQGDFVGVFMELMKPELDRPAKDLYNYELTSLLHQAIRSTNAQFDDPDILSQLEVKLMGSFDGDFGWDVFTLNYTVRGPLAPMLQKSAKKCEGIFKPLWKMKHLEYVLSSKIWKDQICNAKLLKSMQKELNAITYRLNLYTSEMIHFIHQIQYYIMFEVIECLWTRMLDDIEHAKTLDDILEAHIQLLQDIALAGLMDDQQKISVTLQTVWSAMIKLEAWQDKFYDICFVELNARKREQEDIKSSEAKGKYGVTAEKRFERDQEHKVFRQQLVDYEKSLEKVGRDYQIAVQQFLLELAQANNHNLQLFGTRLDFNEYYKKRDYRLDAPLMFVNMRQSSMFKNNKSSTRLSRFAANN